MEIIGQLLSDLPSLLTWEILLAVTIGTLWGIIAGALPGITTSVGTAMMLPFTFALSPAVALALLISIYIGGEYGGSIPAILLKIPGEPSNAACMEDGYALHERGQSGIALGMSLIPGFIASIAAGIAFLFLAGPLTAAALAFGPAEYFALFVFALTAIAGLSGGGFAKGAFAVFLGLALAAIGTDPQTAALRLTFGLDQLREGLPLVPVVVGLFAVAQVLAEASSNDPLAKKHSRSIREMMTLPRFRDYWPVRKAIAIGTFIGIVGGILPGVGGTVSSFVAFTEARRFSKRPEEFGHGSYEGIAAPEAANNAVGPAALIPAVALGIPGNASAAIILVALVLHGFRPGPGLLDAAPQLLSAIFVAIVLASLAMVIFGYLLLPVWVWMVSLRKSVMLPAVLILVAVGMYAERGELFSVWVALVLGIVGYVMTRYGFPVVATVIAFVLGTFIEENLRRALVISDGDVTTFVTRPLSLVFILLTVLLVTLVLRRSRKQPSALA